MKPLVPQNYAPYEANRNSQKNTVDDFSACYQKIHIGNLGLFKNKRIKIA